MADSDYNAKILQLLKSDDPANIELAFQLCVEHDGVYNNEVASYLQDHVLLCLRYGLESDYCSTVTELNLEEKGLKSLPPELGQLHNLQELNLWNNHLASLPPELGQLQDLVVLDLGYNSLKNLPPELGQLQALESLNLGTNFMTSLLPEIGQLRGL
ncbi:MAG TPA: hypothetical protein DCS93_13780 [Microscillaceae bacterium]|nr:hypothetical protein [Microscillaceae bacterium]